MCNTSRIALRHVSPIRSVKPSLPLLLSLLPASLPAFAAGLGELTPLSRIGEPLRAEVGIIATPDEKLDTACFNLITIKDAELPVVSNARLQLESSANGSVLRIATSEALLEPLVMLRLRASCGIELQRDYIIMPLLPDSQEQSTASSTRPIGSTTPPSLNESRRVEFVDRPAPSPRPRRPKPPPEAAPAGDRLVLGSAPMQIDYNLPPSIIQETEARMLRMETSLSNLQESLQKLDGALALGAEIKAAEKELQMATSIRQLPEVAPPPAPAPESRAWLQWLELLGGAVIGGVVIALLMQQLGRFRPGYRGQ